MPQNYKYHLIQKLENSPHKSLSSLARQYSKRLCQYHRLAHHLRLTVAFVVVDLTANENKHLSMDLSLGRFCYFILILTSKHIVYLEWPSFTIFFSHYAWILFSDWFHPSTFSPLVLLTLHINPLGCFCCFSFHVSGLDSISLELVAYKPQ